MSKITQICILLLSITYSIQSQESCEKTIGCLDKKLSFASDELDKNKNTIQQQQTTIDKLKEELQGYKSKCDAKDAPTTTVSTTSSTTTAATTTTASTTTAATTTAPVQPCPSGWSSFGDFCYNIFLDKQTADGAQNECKKHGANLASIHSWGENEFVRGLGMGQQQTYIWIGLKEYETAPNQFARNFVWLDGTPRDYNNWAGGEPNYVQEQCVEMYPFIQGLWNNRPCGYPNIFGAVYAWSYVCKKPKNKARMAREIVQRVARSDPTSSSKSNSLLGDWRNECGLSSNGKWQAPPSSTTSPGTSKAPGLAGLAPASPEICNALCPNRPSFPSKPKDDGIADLLAEKINTIKELLNSLLPLFKSSGKDPGPLESVLDGLNKLLDSLLKGLLSGLKGDLDPLKKLSAALDKLLADLPKVETPTEPEDTASLPRTLLEPTRRRRQAIQLLGLEGLIANVLKLVKQLVNDLLPALQKLLKDIGPDLLQLLDKLLGSLRELLDKVLTGLILALGGNSSFLSAISGGLKLLGALG